MTLYQPTHESQLNRGNSPITRSSGCTWTSGATGADAATGGDKDRTPDWVHGLVKNSEETTPKTPGWSLGDLDLAMSRMGVPFEVRSGQGWPAVVEAHNDGFYVVLQGDSDQFGDHTCSGAFDGDHCIGIRPETSVGGKWLIDDPICPDDRYETVPTLFAYARKLSTGIRFGVFTTKVPQVPAQWAATIKPLPGRKTRQFALYMVEDHDDRPLRIVDRKNTTTKGRVMDCSSRIKAVKGPGWRGTPPPEGLVRLERALGGWSYVDAKFASRV